MATDPNPFTDTDLGTLQPIDGSSAAPGAGASSQVPGTPGGRGDWLANNGLKSPSCRGSSEPACLDSGTRSIPSPPGHYDLDTWMESGTLGLPKFSNLLAEITSFLWSLIVAITAALFAALEWALNLDLLLAGNGALSRLKVLESSWAYPVGAILFGLGAMWVALQSTIAQRMGGALGNVGIGLIVAGLSMAILSNPAGTIGSLSRMSGELGREAAAAPLNVVDRGETLTGGMERMWEAAIERPFALLEFGDVNWGTKPSKLHPAIAREARRIAESEGDHMVRRAAQANTNVRFHLLWAANSNQRNNRDDEGCDGGPCLLRVMCGSDDMDKCTGSMAKYVEARTEEGVRDRAIQVVVIGLGMASVWIVLAAITFGLLWAAVTAVTALIELAFVWPLAMTFKPQLRKKVTELLMRLVGSALAYVVFGIAAGITMTAFVLTQRVPEGWLVQWVLTIVGMVTLWKRRAVIGEYMKALTSGERTATAAGSFAGRLASSYATGLGLGALRGATGGGVGRKMGAQNGASGGGGGGLPTSLPGDGGPDGGGPGRGALAAGVLAGGLVAGPVGSAAAVAALKRDAIAGQARGAAQKFSGPVKAGMAATAGRGIADAGSPLVGPGGVVQPRRQAEALLAGQRAARQAAAAQAREQLPAAREALRDAERFAKAAQIMRAAHPEEGPGVEGAQARVDATEQARMKAAAVVDQLEHVESAAAETDRWMAGSGGGFSEESQERAAGWLDQQAELPQTSRSYRQLAAMHGVSPTAWSAMGLEDQERVRVAIDASLTARVAEQVAPRTQSPLAALGKVAAGQRWGAR